MNPPERILVVGPSWVGDMVMAQSLFKVLHTHNPDGLIDVLAPAWSRPLLERMPEVQAAVDMPFAHGQFDLAGRWRFGRSLRGSYDQAILLPNSWKSALIPFAARIPLRTGWLGEARYGLLNDARRLDKARYRMTVQRFVALALAEGEEMPPIPPPRLQVEGDDVAAAQQAMGVRKPDERRVLGLCPGAEFGESKRWPSSSYASLARLYLARGWDVWLFGSAKDQAACEQIDRESGGRCVNLAGRTQLAQAVDLMSLADAVVSNDSGLMHVAAALDLPLVAIYGSTDPGFTPPLNARHEIVSRRLDCSPCFKRECPLGHLDCLNQLPVEQVQGALQRVLADA